MKDKGKNLDLVCKIDIKDRSPNSVINRWTCQIYSMFMAKVYRQYTCELNLMPLYFLPPILYELNEPFMGTKLIYAEPFIDPDTW